MAELVVRLLFPEIMKVVNLLGVTPVVDRVEQLIYLRESFLRVDGDFKMILRALEDADKREQGSSEVLDIWVNQVRDIAFEMEDVIDEVRGDLEMSGNGFLSVLMDLSKWNRIARKIGEIGRHMDDIKRRKDGLFQSHIQDQNKESSSTADSHTSRLVLSSIEDSEIVGFRSIKTKLIERLMEESDDLQVFAIVGMVGVGKTTLLNSLSKDEVVNHFECSVWLTGHDLEAEVNSVLQAMTNQFGLQIGSSHPYYFARSGLDELTKNLMGKKYIAFIDNVDTMYSWEMVKNVFPNNGRGSKVVVTTQLHSVGKTCAGPENVVSLGLLSRNGALELLCRKSLKMGARDCPLNLKGIGRKIVEDCGRLPLAIVSVGGYLAGKDINEVQWDLFHKNILFRIQRDPRIYDVVRTIFNNLSYHLKASLLYMCMYPPYRELSRGEWSRKLLDESFIGEMNYLSAEGAAFEALDILCDQNLLLPVTLDAFGQVKIFKIHTVIHNIMLRIEQKFMGVSSSQDVRHMRRISIYPGESLKEGPRYKNARSLFVLGPSAIPHLEKFSTRLKVLYLHGVQLNSFPKAIFNMKMLRHLSLRKTGVAHVPTEICRLQLLRTLELKNNRVFSLPKEILELKCLINLIVYDDVGGEGVKLPEKNIRNWPSIEKLLLLNMEDGGKLAKELENLTELIRLCVTSVRKRSEVKLYHSIGKMNKLRSLALTSMLQSGEVLTLDMEAPKALRSLKFCGKLRCMPEWISHHHLTKLHLQYCHLIDDPLFVLGKCPTLGELRLLDGSYDGEVLKSSEFPMLKILYIENCLRLRVIEILEGCMQKLEFLKIYGCESLERIPLGIEHVPSLKEIQLPFEFCEALQRDQSDISQKFQRGLIISES